MNKKRSANAGEILSVGPGAKDQFEGRMYAEDENSLSTEIEFDPVFDAVRLVQRTSKIQGVVLVNPAHVRDIAKLLNEVATAWENGQLEQYK